MFNLDNITVNFASLDYEKATQILKGEGVLIIENVFPAEVCGEFTNSFVSNLEALNPALDRNDLKGTWNESNLPPMTRWGLFQGILSNLPEVWELRNSENVYEIFKNLYSSLREREITSFVSSIDGVNIQPFNLRVSKAKKDWAHLDQTLRDDIYKCIQGQVVLSDSTASFKCSPKSHLVFNELLELGGVDPKDKTNWFKFPENILGKAQELVESVGGTWQIPIYTKKGSMIFWLSSLVHSSQDQIPPTKEQIEKASSSSDEFFGWRSVVYICLRPKEEIPKAQFKRLAKCIAENRATNHWGSKLFPKKARFHNADKFKPCINELVEKPEKLYEIVGHPSPNPEYINL